MKNLITSIVFAAASILASGFYSSAQEGNVNRPQDTPGPSKVLAEHLPNAIQVHSKVISGGQPDGEQAFRELKELGVKTIISVDGAKPEVALAQKYGLRYVHLPHGYDGIAPERSAELAKAVRELDGPIYIHCHHGKHRSPAAAAVACVAAGFIESRTAMDILKIAGTNENYRGLFASVAGAKRIEDAELNAMRVDFPEVAKLTPMAEAMVELDHTHDNLKQFANAGWSTIPKRPDLDPAHEALLLREHFKEMLRLESVAKKSEGFRAILSESEADAQRLESELRLWMRSPKTAVVPSNVLKPFERISASCAACHRQFRD